MNICGGYNKVRDLQAWGNYIRDVPADVCQDCGEQYLDSATTARTLALAEEAERRKVETEIVRYVA